MKNESVKKTRQAEFEKHRQSGLNQKQCAKLLGLTEKTVGGYEKIRKEKKIKKLAEIDDLILRLKKRADDPKINTSDLINLTNKLENLFTKKENLQNQF